MRDEILKAEQYLLKILNFNLENIYELHYKLMISYLFQAKLIPPEAAKVVFAAFNDSYFIISDNDLAIEYRIPSCVLLGCKMYSETIKSKTEFDVITVEQILLKEFSSLQGFSDKCSKFAKDMLTFYKESESPNKNG